MLPLDGSGQPKTFLATQFEDRAPVFSPNGRWLVYVSDKTGRWEVYVQPYPGPGSEITISTDGGSEPMWSKNGRELFYRNGNRMMVVTVDTNGDFQASTPRELFRGDYDLDISAGGIGGHPNYDVAEDGRFLMVKSLVERPDPEIILVRHWFDELERLVPAP